MFYRNLKIAAKLALLGGLLLTTTVAVGVGGWQALVRTHTLQIESAQTLADFAQASDTARVAQVDFKKQVQEWKDLLLRGADPAAFDRYRQAFVDESAATQSELNELKSRLRALHVDTSKVDAALATHADLQEKYLDALKHYDGTDVASPHVVDGLVKGIDRAPTAAIDDIVAFVVDQSAHMSAQINEAGEHAYRVACLLLVSLIFCAIVCGTVVTWLLSRTITTPIREAARVAQAVASGDLRSEVPVVSRDETGQLLTALNGMTYTLRGIVTQIREGATTISSATSEIAAGHLDLSARTEQQAASLEETSASMQHFTETVRQNATSAGAASRLAGDASRSALDGGVAMHKAVDAMQEISESSRRITDIVGVIEAIAAQTNILALNAAVEAARAGPEGRGFAVVAGEVRNLAKRSADAAREIKALIRESVSTIDTGSHFIDHASETIKGALDGFEQLTRTVEAIAEASADQADGIRQVNDAISQMDQVTQSNAALVEQAAAATSAVESRASELVQSVLYFRLIEDEALV